VTRFSARPTWAHRTRRREFEARALTVQGYVTLLYRALLARDPDLAGLEYHEGLFTADFLQAVQAELIGSAEFRARLPELCPA
jgi:hypothetical protein